MPFSLDVKADQFNSTRAAQPWVSPRSPYQKPLRRSGAGLPSRPCAPPRVCPQLAIRLIRVLQTRQNWASAVPAQLVCRAGRAGTRRGRGAALLPGEGRAAGAPRAPCTVLPWKQHKMAGGSCGYTQVSPFLLLLEGFLREEMEILKPLPGVAPEKHPEICQGVLVLQTPHRDGQHPHQEQQRAQCEG